MAEQLRHSQQRSDALQTEVQNTQATLATLRQELDGTTPDSLLASADAAMYSAKRTHSQVAFASNPSSA